MLRRVMAWSRSVMPSARARTRRVTARSMAISDSRSVGEVRVRSSFSALWR